jgi:hypothetical protein
MNKALPTMLFLTAAFAGLNSSSEPLDDQQLEIANRGIFYGCMQMLPADRRTSIKAKEFCSCYTDEMTDSLTSEEFASMRVDNADQNANPSPNIRNSMQHKAKQAFIECADLLR